jgi:FixJ family two-component response regulator
LANQAGTVVIIDDDAGLRNALKRLLATEGYRTELFCSADEYLLAANASEADCLIIDVHLPNMSGLELVRLLRAKGVIPPTIFITGSDDPIVRAAASELGCVAYLLKPFPPRRLLAAIDLAIRTLSI